MKFNVLTDPWIPLDGGSRVRLTSYPDLMTGAADAEELLHVRDDFRFFARMLLSALTQALSPARDVHELHERLERPLPAATVEAVIARVHRDFELVGKGAFLQATVGSRAENETSRLVLDAPSGSNHLLFRHP